MRNASNSTENQVAVPRTLMITSIPRSDHFLSMPSAWPSVLSGRIPLPHSSWFKGMLIHRNSSVWPPDRILWFNKSVCHVSDLAVVLLSSRHWIFDNVKSHELNIPLGSRPWSNLYYFGNTQIYLFLICCYSELLWLSLHVIFN